MNTIRYPLLPALMAASMLFGGGCGRHYVDVYVNDECYIVTHENDKVIDPLLVFADDFVVFNNISDKDVKLSLPEGVFERSSATIPAYQRVILKVIQKHHEQRNLVVECSGGSTTPKVFVGDEP